MSIPAEKLRITPDILRSQGVDLWLTFVRESSCGGDPVLSLILGHDVTWQSCFLVAANGERVAIVGRHDGVRESEVWPRVVTYVESPRQLLTDEISRLDPARIAINYSLDDTQSDGLSHGMYLRLVDYLRDTKYADRLESAAAILDVFRGHKTAAELERMREAIAITNSIIDDVSHQVAPGWSETRVYDFVRDAMKERGVPAAWDPCPLVTSGPESEVGHGAPSAALTVAPGQIFHIDVGVKARGYCSDLQRSWYVPHDGETALPDDVARAFDTVRAAIDAAFSILEPGIEGWRVDAASRKVITDAGYEEYAHCVGHQVGQAVHDGGTLLGPRWERYGETVERTVASQQVYTLELGVMVEGRGYLGLEDMVLVGDDGCEWMSPTPRELPLLR